MVRHDDAMPEHVFVDECKDHGYLVLAASLPSEELRTARKLVMSLYHRNQRRLHFKSESDSSRRKILAAIAQIDPEVLLYDGSNRPRPRRRDACLIKLVHHLAAREATELTLERDDGLLDVDRKLLYQQTRVLGWAGTLRYRHLAAHEEPLLAIPDAIAWCWNRGGEWRQRVRALITSRYQA